MVGMATGVVTASSIGALAEMIIGTKVTFGAATGPKTAFGGQSLEKRFYRFR